MQFQRSPKRRRVRRGLHPDFDVLFVADIDRQTQKRDQDRQAQDHRDHHESAP